MASERASRSGFLLVEALVAVAVAGLVLAALAGAFAVARGQARAPADVLESVLVARLVVATSDASAARGSVGTYRFTRTVRPVEFRSLPAAIAPAPRPDPIAEELLGTPPSQAAAAPPPSPLVRQSIRVQSPSGRTLSFEAIGRDTRSAP